MKYNRKAVIAAIVQVQAKKFEEERKRLEAEKPILENKLNEAAANYVSGLTKEQIIKGLTEPVYCGVHILTNCGEATGATFSIHVRRNNKDKAFKELKEANDRYIKVSERIRKISFYIDNDYKYIPMGNLIDKVKKETPYDYELQATELLKDPELSANIEELRKRIFED